MITEVSILCGHDDDGKLSFRDYMNCMSYEKIKNEHNKVAEEALEAAEECLERGITDPQESRDHLHLSHSHLPPMLPPHPHSQIRIAAPEAAVTPTHLQCHLHQSIHAPCAVPPPIGARTHDQHRG